jgi:hypothetical protein
MDAVCGACQRFLTQYLTTNNCLSIRQFAEQHNCVSLMHSVDDFAMEHFPVRREANWQVAGKAGCSCLLEGRAIPGALMFGSRNENEIFLTHRVELAFPSHSPSITVAGS